MSLSDDLARLNPQQLSILKGFKGPSIIVAGPGTGKTRTVAVLIGKLLIDSCRMKEILALSFSEKAANELRKRVLDYFPRSFDECWISTFHSFCARILREQFHIIGIHPEFKLLTGFKEALLISRICEKVVAEDFPIFGKVIRKREFQLEILTFIALLKSNIVSPGELSRALPEIHKNDARTAARLSEIHILYKLYEEEREKAGYLDYRDLISLTIKVLTHPQTAQYYKNKFRVVLIDEFQDTDPAQLLLLSLLKGNEPDTRLAVIGDPKQSIYAFRGADPKIMDKKGSFRRIFKSKVFHLQMNYRSASRIINLASKLQWSRTTGESSNDDLISCKSSPGFTELIEARDELEEARIIARKIASLLIYGSERVYRPDEIAILVRNNFQIDLITESLRSMQIPYDIAGDMKFFKSEEITTIASLLKASTGEGEIREDSLRRAFASPIFGIDPLWVQAVLAELGGKLSLGAFLENISRDDFAGLPSTADATKTKAKAFSDALNLLHDCLSVPLSSVVMRLQLVFKDFLSDPASLTARNLTLFRNFIADYIEVFRRYESREPLTRDLMKNFDELITYYASTLKEEEGATGDRGVRIMTIHQAKGLEYPVVFICGLCDGQFPVKIRENLLIFSKGLKLLQTALDSGNREIPFFNPYPADFEEHLEEERRLLYVAITRAEEGLILTYQKRLGNDPVLPSPFIAELGLQPQKEWNERKTLSLSELRSKLSRITPEEMHEIEAEMGSLRDTLSLTRSTQSLSPREFSQPAIDPVVISKSFRFSAQSLKDYLDCPRRFFFLRVLRIQDPFTPNSTALLRGQAVHACLAKIHDPQTEWGKGKKPDDADLLKIWQTDGEPFFDSVEPLEKAQNAHDILNCLPLYRSAIYDNGQIPPHGTMGIEMEFNFTFRGYQCGGRFDRILETSDGVWIVDYKTGNPLSIKTLVEKIFNPNGPVGDIQLPFYLLAAREMKHQRVSAMTLHVMNDPYKKKWQAFKPGFLKSAALNLGCGPQWGFDVAPETFDAFASGMENLMMKISQDRRFDCKPSKDDSAVTCLTMLSHKKCQFTAFCQERIEEMKNNSAVPQETDESV